jgi:hypothetical protein
MKASEHLAHLLRLVDEIAAGNLIHLLSLEGFEVAARLAGTERLVRWRSPCGRRPVAPGVGRPWPARSVSAFASGHIPNRGPQRLPTCRSSYAPATETSRNPRTVTVPGAEHGSVEARDCWRLFGGRVLLVHPEAG